MTAPSKNSVKRKVMLVIMLTSMTVLLVTVTAFMVYDVVTFRQTLAQNLDTQARMIGENCDAALIFKNQDDAAAVLSSLHAEPHIVAAALYDDAGKIFAKYPASIREADLPAAPLELGHQFEKSKLTLFQPVVQSGTRLGTLYLESDLTALTQRQQLYGVMSLFVIAGSMLVALWLSHTLQKRIANPIIALAETARNITGKQNFSVRAEKTSDDELGDLTGAFNTMLDQIQLSHADLEKSRAQLQIVTDYASVLLCHVDRHQCFHFVNPAYAARFNLTPQMVVGRTVADVVGTTAYESFRHFMERALAGERVEFELEIPYEKLGRHWMHCIYVPEKNGRGEIIGFVGIINDVTVRKRQEVELAGLLREQDAQARLFDATLSSIADLAYTFDLAGNWIYANKPLLELWGKSLAEIRGKSSLALGYPPELAERLEQQVKQVIQTGKPVKGETSFTDSKGIEDYHEYIFSPVFAADGGVSAVCGTTRLTTERKHKEIELKNARDQALAASRAKDDFLAALSHELRTPLNPVLLLASAAAEDAALPAEIRAQFATIRNNVELEARLIDDLLDLTRITRGKLSLDMHALDVHAVLSEAISIIRSEAERKQVCLTLDFALNQPMILGDAVRLQQIFWNVLKNAVKFTPEAGRITIQTRTLPDNGYISIKVTDTGIGMTPGEIDHIFDAFSQGDHATAGGPHRFGGLGLGLTISRKLVELHSGAIHAASPGRDQGATFTMEFPPAPARERNDLHPRPEKYPAQNLQVTGKAVRSLCILLVEDHEATRIALGHLLARRDHKVTAAASVAQARVLALQAKFDLVISDIGLPDGDGYKLMSELRDNFGLKGIALTGYGMEQDVMLGQKSGFVAHLVKPVRVESLEKALADAI